MWTTIKQAYDLVGRDRPLRWILLVAMALIVSGLEMVGAVLVYALLGLVSDPSSTIDLPLIGNVRGRFDHLGDDALLLWMVAIMAIFFVLRAVVKVSSKYVQARVAHNAGARLSTRLFEGYLRWPYTMHLERTTSELIRNGHQVVIEAINQVVIPAIRTIAESLIVLGLLAVLVTLAPLATLAAIAVIGGAALALLLLVQPRLKALGEVRHREAKATLSTMQQGLFGIRDVKVLGRERAFAREYGRSRLRMARAGYIRSAFDQLPNVVFELALMGFIVGFFAFAVLRDGEAQELLSVLGLFAYAGLRMQPSMQLIIQSLNSLKFAAAPLDDLHRDLSLISKNSDVHVDVSPFLFQGEVRLEDVSFRYSGSDRDALRNICLDIRRGEQLGIVGPTGGGKTTLIDIITGLIPPTRGSVKVDGRELQGSVVRAWQASIGIVAQMVFLTDDTLRRNIALGLQDDEIDADAVLEAVRLAQLEDFVSSLPSGLETTVGERGVRISGGQRQRIAIARALYRRPSVLIFDEGTSALDNTTEALMMESIQNLRGSHTVILVAHRLTTVRDSDRIAFVENGQIAGFGDFASLWRDAPAFRAMAGGDV